MQDSKGFSVNFMMQGVDTNFKIKLMLMTSQQKYSKRDEWKT